MSTKTIVKSFLKSFAFCAAMVISVLLVGSNFAQAASKPANPKVSVKAGTYYVSSYKSVKLSTTTDGAKIYYSTDGKTYSEYTKAVKITKSCTLYAYSELTGVKSDIVTKKYKLKVRLSGITPDEGEYDGAQTVKISTKAKNVTIYYTLDGTKPTTKSAKYTSDGIKLDSSCSLRLLIKKSGFTSRYKTVNYVIKAVKTDNKTTDATVNVFDASKKSKITEFILTDGYDIYGRKFSDRVYYSMLDSYEKIAYELIYKALIHHQDTCNISRAGLTSSRAFEIFDYVINESPELFWANDGKIRSYGYNLELFYTNTVDEANSRFLLLEKTGNSVAAAAENTKDLYEKVKYIHDWIVDKAEYSYDISESRDMAGTDDIIIDGKGLCTAYARTFAYLCHKSGIECVMVNGRADNGSGYGDHSWNLLKLDGKWYAMDVTWDDPIYSGGYKPTEEDKVYTYFCVPDSEIGKDHILNDLYKFSKLACVSSDYTYASRNGIPEFSSVEAAFNYLRENVDNNYYNGKKKTEIGCATLEMANELINYISTSDIRVTYFGFIYGANGRYV